MKVVLLTIIVSCFANTSIYSQNDSIQTYILGDDNVFTRGLFMSQGRYEVKIFSNLYTETTLQNQLLAISKINNLTHQDLPAFDHSAAHRNSSTSNNFSNYLQIRSSFL